MRVSRRPAGNRSSGYLACLRVIGRPSNTPTGGRHNGHRTTTTFPLTSFVARSLAPEPNPLRFAPPAAKSATRDFRQAAHGTCRQQHNQSQPRGRAPLHRRANPQRTDRTPRAVAWVLWGAWGWARLVLAGGAV